MSSSADIVIAGGGMVGTAAAATIAKLAGLQNHKIVLLESSPRKEISLSPEYSNRVAALSPSTVELLDRLGAWQLIQQVRTQPVRRMKVWESCSDSAITFGDEVGEPLATLVENDLTVKALTEVNEACPNVEIRYGAKVESYRIPSLQDCEQVPGEAVVIEMEGGERLEAGLLVGADGFSSLVRRSLQKEEQHVSWQYSQMGLVATLALAPSSSPNVTAWQRFLPSGPLAVLPLSATTSSLVWTVAKGDVAALLSLSEEAFLEAVNTALYSRKGEQGMALAINQGLSSLLGGREDRPAPPTVTGVSQRAAFPLGFGHSPRYIGARAALVGDSAHRVHPLAGQGANLGFGDVRELAEQVQAMVRDGAGLGHR